MAPLFGELDQPVDLGSEMVEHLGVLVAVPGVILDVCAADGAQLALVPLVEKRIVVVEGKVGAAVQGELGV
jgi:hypothetical protein